MSAKEKTKEQLNAQLDRLRKRVKSLEDRCRVESSDRQAMVTALLNATSDLAVVIDTKGKILEVSGAAATRAGKEVDQLMGSCIFDYFKPEMVEYRKAYVNIVIQSRQMINYEDHYEDVSLLVCIHPIFNAEDEVDKLAVFVSDNTELKKNEGLLHRYSQILATIHDPITYIDKNFHYQTVNEAALKIYGKTKDQMVEQPVEEVVGEKIYKKAYLPHILNCLKGEKAHYQDWFDYPDGVRRFMYMSFYPLFAKDNVVSGAVVNSVDVTKMKEMEEKLKLLSQTDQLTQIYNRVKFHDALNQEIARIRRYETDLSLIMLDLDHFKQVNDTHGHDVGDDVLVNLTLLVKECIRETDIFARWGGEEFMVLLPHTNLHNAAQLAERIRTHVEHNHFKTVGKVTSSFGVTQFVLADNAESFIKRVDRALYKAKQKGRNRVVSAQAREKDDE